MGFFDLFRRKKEEISEEKLLEVNLSNLDSWLKEEIKDYFKDLNENSTEIISKMQNVLRQLRDNTKILEKANVKEEKVDFRLMQIVLGNRKSLINKINNFIDSINFPKEIGYKNMLEFYNFTLSRLNEFNRNSVQSYQQTEILFSDEAKKILENVKSLDNSLKEIENLIKDKKDLVNSIGEVYDVIESLRESVSLKRKNEIETENQKSDLEDLTKILNDVENEIKKLITSEKWKKLNELKEENENVEMEIEKIKNDIVQLISPLDRPLKKFENLIISGKKEFPNKRLIKGFIENTFETLIAGNDLENFTLLLENVSRSIKNNEIELKDEKKDKVVTLINEILESSTLKDYIKKYKELNKKRESIKNDIENLEVKEKSVLEKDLDDNKNKIEKIESNLQILKEKTDSLKDEIEKDKSLVEGKIKELTNRDIRILINNSKV